MGDVDELFKTLTDLQAGKRLPPVHNWHPEREGAIDIRIDEDGAWFHDGRLIRRQPIVDIFATILRLDEGEYFLVTPVEKLRIDVADVPFIAIDMDARGAGETAELVFTTNVGDHVFVDAEHALTMRDGRPYVDVRDGLLARVTRSVYYRLVELGVEEEGGLYVYSRGARFYLGAL